MKLRFLHKSSESDVQVLPSTHPASSPTNPVEFPKFAEGNTIAEVKIIIIIIDLRKKPRTGYIKRETTFNNIF